ASDHVLAHVVVARVETPGAEKPKDSLITGFATEFEDADAVVTTNYTHISVFTPLPSHDTLYCPALYDLEKLLAVHNARVSQLSRGRRAILPEPRTELAEHRESYRKR